MKTTTNKTTITLEEAKALAAKYRWDLDHVGPDGRYDPLWHQAPIPPSWADWATEVRDRIRAEYAWQLRTIRANHVVLEWAGKK